MTFYPDNYYKYNLNGVLETDFSQIKTNSNIYLRLLFQSY